MCSMAHKVSDVDLILYTFLVCGETGQKGERQT